MISFLNFLKYENNKTTGNNAYNLWRGKWYIPVLGMLQADKKVLRKPPQVIYANRNH